MHRPPTVVRFDTPTSSRTFPKGRFDVIEIGGMTLGRATYEPGWRWSDHIGPGVGRDRCDSEHVGFVLSGAATAAFDDGSVLVFKAGDVFYVPPERHDSWVVGDEPYVSLHVLGSEQYARRAPVDAHSDRDCFVCGWTNPTSLGVSFTEDAGTSRATYVVDRRHCGWPGLLHGGVLFAILDDAVGWAARFAGQPSVTGRADIRYRQTVGVNTALDVTAEIEARRGRALTGRAIARRRGDAAIVASFAATLLPRRGAEDARGADAHRAADKQR